VREFLVQYGHRAPDREIDLGLPRFTDDPGYVVELLRGYLAAGETPGGDLLARHAAGLTEAEEAAAELVAAVRRTRGPLAALFLAATLDRLRELAGLRERPKFDMVRAMALGRELLQQVGRGLVAERLLDDPEDVFFLRPDELAAAWDGGASQLRARAARNRAEYAREMRRRSIPRLLTSEGEAVYGPTSPAPTAAGRMVGTGVSPGVHEGVARVLDSPVGAGLRPGEVLVAATTDPGWTPLFGLAGALVMEVGGVVSHGAIVAREYGISAVAAVSDATTRLLTGQLVRVDGGAGVVTMVGADANLRPRPPESAGPS
jgi:pyruvate,water dikinase